MKFIAPILLLLLVTSINIHCNENASNFASSLKDIELAAHLGSDEGAIIDLNATEGLEGKIAQKVRDTLQKTPEPLTFIERVKSFFSNFYSYLISYIY